MKTKLRSSKKNRILILLLCIISLALSKETAAAPISGVVTVGTGGTYPNLTGASGLFNAINTGTVTGNIYVSVRSDLVETGTVALNQFAAGYKIQIRPSGSLTTRVIQGTTLALFVPLISLNGADFVSINGADSATNTGQYFRFINNSSPASNTGPVFQMTNDARQDSIRNCIIESNSTGAFGACVVLGTTTGTLGNDSIFVDKCLFKQSAGANPGRYRNAYYTLGTGGGPGAKRNSDNFITNCNFTGMLGNSDAVILTGGDGNGDNWTISNNKFYNDINFTGSHTTISIGNTSTNNVTISGNSIGGSAPDRSGTSYSTNSASSFSAIGLSVGTTTASNVQGNIISNFGQTFSGGSDGACGILVSAGKVNIGTTIGNTIGGLANPWDTLRAAYDNGWIQNRGSTDTVRIENNTIGNYAYYGADVVVTSGILTYSGVNIIRNNTVRNGKGNNTGTINGSFSLKGIQIRSSTAGQIVEGNTIYNLQNNNTGASNYATSAIHFSTSTGLSTVSRNRIYNITSLGTGTGANAPVNIGIDNSSASLNIINNQISLSASTLEPRLIGIYNNSTGNVTTLYNSVYLGGVCANTAQTSYGYLRNSTSNDTVRNNLFFNQRTGGANNYCIGVTSATGWTSRTANYNAYFPSAVNQVGVIGAFTQQTFDNWKINALSDRSSISATGVSSANLFTSTATGNLNINPNNAECLNINGFGTPITTPQVLNDYETSSTVRSVTFVGGVTDIGSDEFTPVAAPSPVTQSGSPANNTTTTYTYNGRVLGSIDWGAGGTVPTGITFTYFPGVNPPGSIGFPVANGYWLINATGGSGYSYNITINYDDAIIGEITSEEDIRLSKSEDGGATWNTFTVSGTAAGQYELDLPNNTIKVYGLTSFSTFCLTDVDLPLPVELTSFTSSVSSNNVTLNWSTVQEQNNKGFEIERNSFGAGWKKVGYMTGHGTTNTQQNYIFKDNSLNTGRYSYRLKQIDYNGNFEYYELSNEVAIGVPSKYLLAQNYPNPFNPATRINYELPITNYVSIKIFDITGKEVASLVNEVKDAGYYSVTFDARNLSSGTYFYKLSTDKFSDVKKMVVIK